MRKINLLIGSVELLFLFVLTPGCAHESNSVTAEHSRGPDSSVLVLQGKKIDTAFMFVDYVDQGATLNEYTNGELSCPLNIIWASVTGYVNTNIPGEYILNYNANDELNNSVAQISRTVHVIENSSNFLSGIYKVVCTCTAISSSNSSLVTNKNYTAVVNPGNGMGHFQMIPLDIGAEQVLPQALLSGGLISLGYFGSNYANCTASGTLSAAKNTFTIETQFQRYSPPTNFLCKNIFTKLLTIKTVKVTDKN